MRCRKLASKHVLLVAAMVLMAGCVSKVVDAPPVPVATTQNSEGITTLTWPSKVGYGYRLVARDLENRAIGIGSKLYIGTGEIITVQVKRDPDKNLPVYSARPEKLKE